LRSLLRVLLYEMASCAQTPVWNNYPRTKAGPDADHVVEMTSRDELTNAISLNSSIVNGARVVGPAVAGAVMALSRIGLCFFLNGLSFIAVIAALLMMRLPARVRPAQKESAWKQALSGFHYLGGNFHVCV
jgi:hypothetical protein